MANTDRWERRRRSTPEEDEDTMIRLHEMDTYYDQQLLRIKELVDEKNKTSDIRRKKIYTEAINKIIEEIQENMWSEIPKQIMDRDIEMALEGRFKRPLTPQVFKEWDGGDDIVKIRKKKTVKPKPKRKVKKVIKRKRK